MFTTEFLDLPALQQVQGRVRLPGSKSISNRVLLLAGLCEGRTDVVDLLDSDDTRVMLDALRALGCGIETVDARTTRVTGLGGRAGVAQADLFLGNAGTAMRPLAAALALLAGLHGGDYRLRGVARMHERPIGDLVDALQALGCGIECLGQPGFPPLRIHRAGDLRLDEPIRVRGDVSSQFLTALLLALPLASATTALQIEVVGELISRPYVEITLNLLQRFGVAVQRDGWQRFTIPAGSRYRTPGRIHVEGDASSASYFIALGVLAATDGALHIDGVGADSIQGDIRFIDAARAMGGDIQTEADHLRVRRGAWPLRAIDLNCNAIPDAAMTLAVMALYADAPSTLRDIASWRVKETDRIAAMAAELRRLGARVEEGPDWLRVHPVPALRAASLRTYDDHRMAMCLSLAAFNGLRQQPAVPQRILDPRCVGKTFPDYFETLFAVARTPTARIPVITVDGPTASGKGTLAAELARRLGYHYLDSGLLYRATALAARQRGVAPDDEAGLTALAQALDLRFQDGGVLLDGADVGLAVRDEAVGALASQVSAWPAVRTALVDRQLSFRRLPGLVADGRDMGTVMFPDAALKVFLTASAAARAERRLRQLSSQGISASLATLRADLEARDVRDTTRRTAPLKPARDARLLDNSALGIEQSVRQVLDWWQSQQPFDRVPPA